MTNDLVQTLRERADTVSVDLDATDVLVGARRRLVRGRVRRAATATVAVAGLALAVTVLTRQDAKDTEPPIATQSMESASYATGSVIIRDGVVLETGSSVSAFVRVPAGTVDVTGEGEVRFLSPKGGDLVGIGTTSAVDPHLVADPLHNQVAWVSNPRGSTAFVVYDVARDTQRTVFAESAGKRSAARVRVYGVDGDTLYARDARGALQVDLRSGRVKVLSLEASAGTIGSVAGGLVAWRSQVPSRGYVVGERFGEGVPTGRRSRPMLSTGGTYLSTDDDADVHVQRTSDAAVVTPRLPSSYTRAIAYGWSDDDHLLVAGVTSKLDGKRVVDLEFLTCSVAEGDCRVTDEGHSYPATFNLPVGEPSLPLAEALRR